MYTNYEPMISSSTKKQKKQKKLKMADYIWKLTNRSLPVDAGSVYCKSVNAFGRILTFSSIYIVSKIKNLKQVEK